MQLSGYGLRRISLLRGWVNKASDRARRRDPGLRWGQRASGGAAWCRGGSARHAHVFMVASERESANSLPADAWKRRGLLQRGKRTVD
jgi:hypothetical protein